MLRALTLVRRLLDHATDSDRRTWLSVLAGVGAVYLATAHWGIEQSNDAVAAAWPGWALAHHGTLFLDGSPYPTTNPWLAPSGGHVVALRTTGIVLMGIPAQLLLGWTGMTAQQGSALTGALVSAAALATLAVVLRSLVRRDLVLAAAGVLAFGTSIWTTAGAELWTHGPDILWLSLALLAASRGRHLSAGCLLGLAVLTRPHLAVVAAALGVGLALSRRSWPRLLQYGVPAAAALGIMIGWNALYTGQARLLVGAYAGQSDRALSAPGAASQLTPPFPSNLVGAFVSPSAGLLAYSPVALVGLVCLIAGWRRAPDWVRVAALGGVGYLLVQDRLNFFEGGMGFYGNRLLIEPLVLLAPLAALGYARLQVSRPWIPRVTRVSALISVFVIATGALLAGYPVHRGDVWRDWYPLRVVRAAGLAAEPALVVAAVAVVLAVMVMRTPRAEALRPPEPASAEEGAPAGR